jgi:hypothetical protein
MPAVMRWLLVPIAAIAVWYGALIAGIAGIGVLGGRVLDGG